METIPRFGRPLYDDVAGKPSKPVMPSAGATSPR